MESGKERKIMLEEIKELVAETLGTNVEDLTEETSFSDDLNADSLDLFEDRKSTRLNSSHWS